MKFSRLIVLGIAISAGGVAAMLAGRSKPPEPSQQAAAAPQLEVTDVLVARGDIPIGKSLKAGDVDWQPWPSKVIAPNFIRKSGDPRQIDEILGSVTRAPFAAGEPLREAKLIKANGSGYMAAVLPIGMRAASTEITPEAGAGGFILPNDKVDVILTSAEKMADKEIFKSRTILADVRVLAIDQAVEEKTGQKTAVGKIATLEVSPSDAEKLSLARRLGSISLVLRSLAENPESETANVTSLDRADSVTIIRYGQSAPQ